MRAPNRFNSCAVLAIGLAAGATWAQTPPAGNLDERVRQQIHLLGEREQAEAPMTGDSDLVLLTRTQLFNAHGSMDVNTTSNAYLSPHDAVADQFGQAQVGVGFGTRVAGKVDIAADLSATTVRYFHEDTLDYSAATFALTASTKVGLVTVSGSYQPQMVFSRGFEHRQLTSHRLRASGSLPFQVGGANVQPEVHVDRSITNPADYKAWSGGVSVTASEPLSDKLPLQVYVSAGYDYRVFDDYFSGLLGLKRKDNNISAGTGIVWRPLPYGEVRANYSFGHNGSTSDVNGYTSHSGTLGVSATLRF